ncbi:transcriptional regulator [Halobacterium sp. R2-5]|uniref:transcriptional regulator n=1 Tax=Halobacterium sp. R2-5 TaxID=2715751 RepID=UPI0014204817|nr:transcriptional regulator [Halobacterium sp. R2-5]NIC00997.1 transcriptional regulator [Halobacterium sp. R2-5]
MTQTKSDLSIDDLLAALSNVQRRQLLESLLTDSPPDDPAYVIVDADTNLAMYHIHLPKLVEYGLINWDEDTNRVTKGPEFEAAADLLSQLTNHDEPLLSKEVNDD